ncbi:MAG: RNA methyltransferase, partial [Alphaproteobacteria bacterium]|nr:RNA methyltransferase [Alphaproteobacteria bacterium]
MPAPAVILVRPQLPENIGACARAMRNFGLTDLRLVAPRERWPNERAVAMAAHAVAVVEDARVHPTLEEAIADLQVVYATTARNRYLVKPILTPRAAAVETRRLDGEGTRVGYLFGPERTGLETDEIAVASAIIEIPTDPDYASLNLAQAVLVCAYEWFNAAPAPAQPVPLDPPATQGALAKLYDHLEGELEAGGFFRTE